MARVQNTSRRLVPSGLVGDYDLIVIGLGMSTGPVIDLLLDRHSQLRALVLEKGREWNPNERLSRPKPVTVADLLVESGQKGKRWAVPWWETTDAGGSSTMWYGQLSRFLADDLRPSLDLLPGRPRWPIDIDDLSPFYRRIESYLAPFGPPQTADLFLECEHYRARPFLSHFEEVLLDYLGSAGFHPYVGMTCLGGPQWESDPVDPLTLQPIDHRHREKVRPTYCGANYGAMRRAGWDVRYGTEALSLQGSSSGAKSVSFRENDGRLYSAEAQTVVIGCGPLKTVPLLATLVDRTPALGRGFTFTLQGTAYVLTSIRRTDDDADWKAGSFASVCSRHLSGTLTMRRRSGKLSIYDAFAFDGVEKTVERLSAATSNSREALQAAQSHYLFKISYKGESIPWEGKQIRLPVHADDLVTLQYEPHASDLASARSLQALFRSIADALPGGVLLTASVPDDADWLSAHQHGGAIFGAPPFGVLDAFGQHHGHEGLFVVDGSSFPSSGTTNTSLTLMANALRCAERIGDHIKTAIDTLGRKN